VDVSFSIPRYAAALAAMLVSMLLAAPAQARVSGPCANCHTMHNSQDGTSMAYEFSGAPTENTNNFLTITTCVGCHSASDGSTWQDPVTGAPIVYNTSQPTYGADAGDGKKQGLAGGNFYWVDQDDSFGHNIFSADPILTRPPGKSYGCSISSYPGSCHFNLHEPCQRGYATRQGCTKCHSYYALNQPKIHFHHADDSATVIDGYAEGWYRYLAGIHSPHVGASGIEDPDWEHSASSSDHNEYLGVAGDKTVTSGATIGNTVTRICIGCHNNFHLQDDTAVGASPWIRHPSDAVLPADGEYAAYTEYDPLVPVARPTLSAVSSTVTPGTDMVMCLSCHRAHGSPYPDMLRFPYGGMQAGGGGADGTGCFKCHTSKDGS
jgi:hypothetical protein